MLWDVAAGKRLVDAPLKVEDGYLSGLAFSPDGKTLAVSYIVERTGGVVLWDAAGGKWLVDAALNVNEGSVRSVAFSPDGKMIVAGYEGGIAGGGVVLWDAAGRKRLVNAPLDVTEGEVMSVTFSPDGSMIAAGYSVLGGDRGGAMLCRANLESWKQIAAQIANRNLTRGEWREYFPDQPYHATFPNLPVPAEAASK